MKTKYVFAFCHSFLKIDLNCDLMLPNWGSFIKKTDEWHIEWQRVTASGIMSDNKWQQMATSCTTSGTTSGITNDNEWKWVTTNYNEWLFRQILFCFREDSTNRQPKENPLNLEEDFQIKSKSSSLEEKLTVRSKY